MEDIITKIILAVLGSGAFSALVSGLVSYFNEKRKDKKGSGQLIMMLTADKIYDNLEKFCEEGFANDEQYKLTLDMYKIYKEQGGNGYAEELKKRAEKLPIKKG